MSLKVQTLVFKLTKTSRFKIRIVVKKVRIHKKGLLVYQYEMSKAQVVGVVQ